MTVYVDYLSSHQVIKGPARRHGVVWAHMSADTLDELHAMAAAIGLRRSYFQDGRHAHYDVTPAKHQQALGRGAIMVELREIMHISRRLALSTQQTFPVYCAGCEQVFNWTTEDAGGVCPDCFDGPVQPLLPIGRPFTPAMFRTLEATLDELMEVNADAPVTRAEANEAIKAFQEAAARYPHGFTI